MMHWKTNPFIFHILLLLIFGMNCIIKHKNNINNNNTVNTQKKHEICIISIYQTKKKHMLQFNATIKIYYKNDFHKCNLFIFIICFSYFCFFSLFLLILKQQSYKSLSMTICGTQSAILLNTMNFICYMIFHWTTRIAEW